MQVRNKHTQSLTSRITHEHIKIRTVMDEKVWSIIWKIQFQATKIYMEKAKFNQATITLKYLQHSGETRRCPGYTRRTNQKQEYEQLIYERTNI